QVVLAQHLKAVIFLACHPGCLVQVPSEPGAIELADDLGAAELLLVCVDLVAPAQPEHAERQPWFAHLQAIAHDLAEEAVERVLTRDVSHIFPVHRAFPPRWAATDASSSAFTVPPCARRSVICHSPRLYPARDLLSPPDTYLSPVPAQRCWDWWGC